MSAKADNRTSTAMEFIPGNYARGLLYIVPQIKIDSKRYRAKEEIAKDVAFILNAPVSYGTKYAVLAEVTWVWTEFDGKHKGCPYWSMEALKLPLRDIDKRTIHEHIVPKKIIINKLFALQKASSEEVYELLDKLLIGIVVTKEEDKRLTAAGYNNVMPIEFDDPEHVDYQNPWLRYARCNIVWQDCRIAKNL